MRRVSASLPLLVLLTVFAAGCEDDPNGPSDPFTQSIQGNINTGGLNSHTFTSDRRGIATVTLTWSTTAVDLDLYTTANSCTTSPFACTLRVFSENVSSSSEEVILGVVQGETIKLWVNHFGGGSQAYTINVSIE